MSGDLFSGVPGSKLVCHITTERVGAALTVGADSGHVRQRRNRENGGKTYQSQ
jgi:hypothetical protein